MIRIFTARTILRLACFVMGVPIPVFKGVNNSFRIRSMLIRTILHANGFQPVVLADGSPGWARGVPKVDEQRGPVGYALSQIANQVPEQF